MFITSAEPVHVVSITIGKVGLGLAYCCALTSIKCRGAKDIPSRSPLKCQNRYSEPVLWYVLLTFENIRSCN